jgi:hypothetical protein
MLPVVEYTIPPNAPNSLKAFAEYLQVTYPLTNTKRLYWRFLNRDYAAKGASGFAAAGEYKNMKYTTLKVALGTTKYRRCEEACLFTIAHEYAHALQYGKGRAGLGPTTPKEELEADLFALKALVEYLNDSSIVERLLPKTYSVTREYFKQAPQSVTPCSGKAISQLLMSHQVEHLG